MFNSWLEFFGIIFLLRILYKFVSFFFPYYNSSANSNKYLIIVWRSDPYIKPHTHYTSDGKEYITELLYPNRRILFLFYEASLWYAVVKGVLKYIQQVRLHLIVTKGDVSSVGEIHFSIINLPKFKKKLTDLGSTMPPDIISYIMAKGEHLPFHESFYYLEDFVMNEYGKRGQSISNFLFEKLKKILALRFK